MVGLLTAVGVALAAGLIPANRELGGILGGCVVLFVAGLLDDAYHLSPIAKLAAQGGAAALVLASGIRVEIVSNDVAATVLGVVWLIGMTNAFNLLDNMDGLAATLAAIACTFFAIDAFTVHPSHLVATLSLGICFACLGFLPFNLRLRGPAAVFMGDSGSQVLGFGLASLGLAASWTVAGSTVATLMLPIIVLAVPILDTTLVTVVRLLEGRPVTRGGRDHASHRLVYQGLSDKRAVVLLCVVSAALGLTSLAYKVLDDTRVTLAGVLITFAFLLQFGSYLADVNHAAIDETPSFFRSLLVHRRRLDRGARRLRAHHCVLYRRLSDPPAGYGPALAAARLRPLAAGDPRRSVRLVHRLRPLPWRVALRRRTGCGGHPFRGRALRRRGFPVHLGDGAVERLSARDVPDRRHPLHVSDRGLALLGACGRARDLLARRTREAAAHPDRRRRPQRSQPAARAARDAGRARRRFRRRRSGPAPPPHPGRQCRRRSRRDRLDSRAPVAGRRIRDDSRRAARSRWTGSSRPRDEPASPATSSGGRSRSTPPSCSTSPPSEHGRSASSA